MPLPLAFERRVALRFLREGRMQSLLIVVGVAAGVAVVAYISALVSGLQRNTFEKTLGAQAHVIVSQAEEQAQAVDVPAAGTTVLSRTQARAQRPRSLANWNAAAQWLAQEPGVTAVSALVSAAALAQRGEANRPVSVLGVDLDDYDRIVGLRSKVVAGAARLAPGEAIVGRDLASDLGVMVGDRLLLLVGTTDSAAAPESVRITALVDLGVRELNRRTVIVPLRLAQSLAGLPGGATHIDVALADPWTADTLAAAWRERLPFKVESWQQSNAQLVSALNAQTISTLLIRVVVMVVVVLGIASVLVVSVVQKQREIGILRAMGATRGQMTRVFLVQGAVVGAVGSALGVLLSVGLIKAFTTFVRGSDGLPLFAIALEPGLALRIAVLATLCGVLAAVAPARRAARLDPAQAIRL